jgi:anti-sigma regulatory factor (Ser/Thr protein kinase)/Fe-S-cluster-containing hydrogenase component 2
MEFVSFDIAGKDFGGAGAASRSIKERLKLIGADAEVIRRTTIAAYEAEMNVVIHAHGGRLEASLSDTQIEVNVIDSGPGIADIELAMSEGFSTANAEARALGFGAGMGLPNIRRNSDRLRVTSRVGEGTRVSFTVYLKPETAAAQRIVSLYASAERCKGCGACLLVCPTRAKRVREGHPSVLEHLCVDCTACMSACASQTWTVRDEVSSLEDITDRSDRVLAVPPALLAGCGPTYSPTQVLDSLKSLGFAEVITVAPFEEALHEAVLALVDTSVHNGGLPGPLIAPSCPAVVNLIELRFPSLVSRLAPFDSPWEALQATYSDQSLAYVVSCPSQRSALLSHEQTKRPARRDSSDSAPGSSPKRAEYLIPELVRKALRARLNGGGMGSPDPESGGESMNDSTIAVGSGHAQPVKVNLATQSGAALLTVMGMSQVLNILEMAESGALEGVTIIEPYACESGCFGSPLLAEDPSETRPRWERGRAALAIGHSAAVDAIGTRPARAVPRRRPFTHRPGVRLDPEMGRAIEKLGRMQTLVSALPGTDCGLCGAPTCAAFAEDVVMGRADTNLCPYARSEKEEADG